jgi:hypothetical protein
MALELAKKCSLLQEEEEAVWTALADDLSPSLWHQVKV